MVDGTSRVVVDAGTGRSSVLQFCSAAKLRAAEDQLTTILRQHTPGVVLRTFPVRKQSLIILKLAG